MPKTKIDYAKTVIYKIVCKDLNVTDVYIGHTTNFRRRKSDHKKCCINENYKSHNLKVYQTIRANGGWDVWQMIEVEKYPCNDENEAAARERYWYEQFNSTMNTYNPNRSSQEYREVNKDIILEYQKKYREANKEKQLKYQKQYREANAKKLE